MIHNQKKLDQFLETIERSPWMALDTEADSLYAYPERLCLVQISTNSGETIVDPFADIDLSEFFSLLKKRTLILHGADFDLRLLRKTKNFVPSRIFDTMIAARLVGETEFGLKALVEKHLGVHLEKTSRKANWSRRPLSTQMIEYAKNDTRHLKPLADILEELLIEKNRLEWHRQSCDRLIRECDHLPVVDHERVWRLKGADKLTPRGLSVLRELFYWREKEALEANRPPYFIVSHERLVVLAEMAQTMKPEKIRLPDRIPRGRSVRLRKVLKRASHIPRSRWPDHPSRKVRDKPRGKIDIEPLKKLRDERAEELGIDPTLIANKSTLHKLAAEPDSSSEELMDWQRDLLNPELEKISQPNMGKSQGEEQSDRTLSV